MTILLGLLICVTAPLVDADPAKEDFVHVLPGGRYFAHSNGSPFIPVSINHNPDWPELEESNPLGKRYDPTRTDRWFAKLQAYGVNVVRLMVETPPSGNLESKVGTIRQEHVVWLDNIFHAARRYGVKLWITPYDTFWMNLKKETSPYWKVNGGPIVNPIDFLTKPEIIAAQENRMKFLIDRYGNSGTVFSWEVMNEIDLWWGASPEQIKAWMDQMVPFVRNYEKRRWGRNHMLTVSFAEAEPKGLNAETAFRRSDLDFATMHLYLGASRHPAAGDEQRAGIDFAAGVAYARSQVRDNRPVLDGESGPIDKWVADESLDDRVFHEMSWRHLMAGGAGPGTRWPYRNPHNVTKGMLETLSAMAKFCNGVEWKSMTGKSVDVVVDGPDGSESAAFATDHGLISWLKIPESATPRAFSITSSYAKQGRQIRAFDLETRKWIDLQRHQSSNAITLSMPPGIREIALWIKS